MDEHVYFLLIAMGSAALLILGHRYRSLRAKYAPIIDVEREAAKRKAESELEIANVRVKTERMVQDYRVKKTRYDELVRTVAAFDEEIELAELGFYEPHFAFDTSERFKAAIKQVREQQKAMMQRKTAIICRTQWTVDNNRRKGQTMINRGIRLTARAFNNECDAAIAKVRWNNIKRIELRMEKAFTAINKANESLQTYITREYLDLKLKELRLTHEYHEKKHEEKEHQAELRRQEREEAQLRREAAEAAKEEERYAKLLYKAQQEALSASAERLQSLHEEIAELTQSLAEAHARNQRAISMAEQTRSGYVYIVSNVGSFGDSVYKIGMTRRLDPMDRVRELSAASVPFSYDTHAMIYSNDAPGMEAALHAAFDHRRVNKVNNRKEFFQVSLTEVKAEVERLFPDVDFIEGAEARDFRETKSLEERLQNIRSKTDALSRFPVDLEELQHV